MNRTYKAKLLNTLYLHILSSNDDDIYCKKISKNKSRPVITFNTDNKEYEIIADSDEEKLTINIYHKPYISLHTWFFHKKNYFEGHFYVTSKLDLKLYEKIEEKLKEFNWVL